MSPGTSTWYRMRRRMRSRRPWQPPEDAPHRLTLAVGYDPYGDVVDAVRQVLWDASDRRLPRESRGR